MKVLFAHERGDRAVPTSTTYDTDAHRNLVSRWTQRYGECDRVSERDGLDREIWYERAARLFAAIDLGYAVEDVPARSNRENFKDADMVEVGNFELGSVPSRENIVAARAWYKNPVFVAGAKREIALCDARDSNLEHQSASTIFERGATLARDRDRDLMLKIVAKAKYGPLTRVTLTAGSSPEDVRTSLREEREELEYAYVALDAEKDVFLWSDYIEMTHEYRIFVVGGVPVTGCGNVPFFDGANSIGKAWDSRMVNILARDRIIEEKPELVERYREFAERLASEALAINPEMRNYCLDLATTDREDIVVVELNSLSRCGTFATDATTLVAATIREVEHRLDLEKSKETQKISTRSDGR